MEAASTVWRLATFGLCSKTTEMPPPEMEEGAKLDKDVNVDKANIGTSKRPAFDLLNFAANGTLVLGVAGLLWLAIENVDGN